MRERVVDDRGRVFTDVTAAYWAASVGRATPPLLAAAIVEPEAFGSRLHDER